MLWIGSLEAQETIHSPVLQGVASIGLHPCSPAPSSSAWPWTMMSSFLPESLSSAKRATAADPKKWPQRLSSFYNYSGSSLQLPQTPLPSALICLWFSFEQIKINSCRCLNTKVWRTTVLVGGSHHVCCFWHLVGQVANIPGFRQSCCSPRRFDIDRSHHHCSRTHHGNCLWRSSSQRLGRLGLSFPVTSADLEGTWGHIVRECKRFRRWFRLF